MVLTTYEANRLLDILLGNATPATVYVGLCTGVSAGGVITGEPVGNNYSRVAVTNNPTNWPAAAAGSKANGAAITFAAPSGAWGALNYFFLSDAATGNTNTIGYDVIASISPVNGSTVSFNISGLTVTLA